MGNADSLLRQRCRKFLAQLKLDALLRQGSAVDDLIAFVIAETGRKADVKLETALPLCLYFPTKAERAEFIAAFLEAKPHVISKRLP